MCDKEITEQERQLQFDGFYATTGFYIGNYTEREDKKRSTTVSNDSRRSYSFFFFLNIGERRIEVCKQYYLGIFDISQTPVYNTHKKKCVWIGMAWEDFRGKTASSKMCATKEKEVIDHINSFPRVESHFCRVKTKKQYLDPNLNITKMFDLYSEKTKNSEKGNTIDMFYYSKSNFTTWRAIWQYQCLTRQNKKLYTLLSHTVLCGTNAYLYWKYYKWNHRILKILESTDNSDSTLLKFHSKIFEWLNLLNSNRHIQQSIIDGNYFEGTTIIGY